jgi:hypothetical protein
VRAALRREKIVLTTLMLMAHLFLAEAQDPFSTPPDPTPEVYSDVPEFSSPHATKAPYIDINNAYLGKAQLEKQLASVRYADGTPALKSVDVDTSHYGRISILVTLSKRTDPIN